MESSRAGRKLYSSCRWDRSGNSLFPRSWVMAIAERERTSVMARLSFLRWSCFPSRTKPKQKLRQNSSARKVRLPSLELEFGLAEEFLLFQAFCLKPFENAGLHAGIIAKS